MADILYLTLIAGFSTLLSHISASNLARGIFTLVTLVFKRNKFEILNHVFMSNLSCGTRPN